MNEIFNRSNAAPARKGRPVFLGHSTAEEEGLGDRDRCKSRSLLEASDSGEELRDSPTRGMLLFVFYFPLGLRRTFGHLVAGEGEMRPRNFASC